MQISLITATYNRAESLRSIVIPSVLAQTDLEFQWVIVNDGGDLHTRDAVAQLIDTSQGKIPITYLEMPHPDEGFGLCHARNLGLDRATGEWVSYLDDDNAIAPQFIASTKEFLHKHPEIQYSMVQQSRRRCVVNQEQEVVRDGKPFISPCTGTGVEALIQQHELFDSNGLTHQRVNAPRWNPAYRVFADYEYLLQCCSQWGRVGFKLNEQVLVDYVQRSDGVIGRSSYRDWASELQAILNAESPALTLKDREVLAQWSKRWKEKASSHEPVPAFS